MELHHQPTPDTATVVKLLLRPHLRTVGLQIRRFQIGSWRGFQVLLGSKVCSGEPWGTAWYAPGTAEARIRHLWRKAYGVTGLESRSWRPWAVAKRQQAVAAGRRRGDGKKSPEVEWPASDEAAGALIAPTSLSRAPGGAGGTGVLLSAVDGRRMVCVYRGCRGKAGAESAQIGQVCAGLRFEQWGVRLPFPCRCSPCP